MVPLFASLTSALISSNDSAPVSLHSTPTGKERPPGRLVDFRFPIPTLRHGECRMAGAGRGLQNR